MAKRYFAKWLFIHGLGKLSAQYSKLSQKTERVALLTENFGLAWQEIQSAHDKRAQPAAPKIDNS